MAVAGYSSQVLIASLPSVAFTNEATTTADRTTYTISNAAHRYFDPKVAVVVQTSPDGSIWTTVTTGFQLFRANARVVFTVQQPIGTQVRFASGNYFPYAQIAEAASCEFSGKMETEDTTTFASATASNGAKSFTPTLLTGTLKYESFWINIARAQSLVARDFLIVSFQTPPGNRYEGFCYASDCNIKDDVGKVVTQDLVFQLTDEFFNS